MSLIHFSLGPLRLLCSRQTLVSAARLQASLCVSVCCVYSLSFLASPNNSPTVINIVWRSLWPAVSGPATQGSGSDADEWPYTRTPSLVELQAHSLSSCQAKGQDLLQHHQTALYSVCVCVCIGSYVLLSHLSERTLVGKEDHSSGPALVEKNTPKANCSTQTTPCM